MHHGEWCCGVVYYRWNNARGTTRSHSGEAPCSCSCYYYMPQLQTNTLSTVHDPVCIGIVACALGDLVAMCRFLICCAMLRKKRQAIEHCKESVITTCCALKNILQIKFLPSLINVLLKSRIWVIYIPCARSATQHLVPHWASFNSYCFHFHFIVVV